MIATDLAVGLVLTVLVYAGRRFPGRVLMVKKHRPVGGTLERWWARWFGASRP